MNSGDLRKKREQDLRSRLEKNPDDRTTRLEYAILLSSSGRDDEAARQFRIAFERHSDDPEAATLYIRFLLARGRGDEAGSVIEQALEHNPMEVEVLKAHAQVLQSNDEYEAALEQLELVRQLTDDDPNLDYSIIECLDLDQRPSASHSEGGIRRRGVSRLPDSPALSREGLLGCRQARNGT
ncbi:MAG: hypothetical protein U5N86_13090 [Planctomycetota bacterium]|nr:hypothetical protein [Planctomycetota bacterium]